MLLARKQPVQHHVVPSSLPNHSRKCTPLSLAGKVGFFRIVCSTSVVDAVEAHAIASRKVTQNPARSKLCEGGVVAIRS